MYNKLTISSLFCFHFCINLRDLLQKEYLQVNSNFLWSRIISAFALIVRFRRKLFETYVVQVIDLSQDLNKMVLAYKDSNIDLNDKPR